MSRIFFAELRRLLHFRLYYLECVIVILCSMLFPQPPVIDSFLFYIVMVIGAFSAVCVSQFIGTEYSCGTIRNKLATGHTRTGIYFAQLILQALAAVENALNLGAELVHGEWFLYVCVRSNVKAFHLCLDVGLGRKENHRDMGEVGGASQHAAEFYAVHVGHHDV